ncbi:phospholipase C/P1 nuclease domain-containing protein [Chiua virens]|nr:phospholipase C/P1 nuclease domain-containing protein [Chiua virens]
MRFSSALTFAVGAALIPQTLAWGAVGHEVVATIAEMHLHPSVMPKLCHILDYKGACHLAPVASWADNIRRLAKYRWTGPLHYVGAVDDYPSQTCAFPGEKGWEGRTHINVLHAIRNTSTVLHEFEVGRKASAVPIIDKRNREDVPDYVQDALKFLIHFVGDMHQPLHLTNRNRGGNDDKVAFDAHTTNLHKVWDSLLITERMNTLSSNYSHPLPLADVELFLHGRNYDPYVRRVVWEGLLGKWEDELESWLACPAPSASEQPHRELPSTWQAVLSLLSSPAKFMAQAVSMTIGMDMNTIPNMSLWDAKEESNDGGLGVDDATLCPYAWAKSIHHFNCDFLRMYNSHVYEHDDLRSKYFELNTPAYAGMIQEEWVIEKLLAQAGVRLAGVLNGIFADAEDGEIRERRLTLY